MPENFKIVEILKLDFELAAIDESGVYFVFEPSTAEKLLMSNVFVDIQNGRGIGLRDVVFGLVQMK